MVNLMQLDGGYAWCSTPHGVTESITPRATWRPTPVACAQRLTGTLNRSRQIARTLCTQWDERSTPHGVTESITLRAQAERTAWRLCSTPHGVPESIPRPPRSAAAARLC